MPLQGKLLDMMETFMDVVGSVTGLPVNIFDDQGYIIRATDWTRIGDLHTGARKIMQGIADEYAVTAEEAARDPLLREGYNCPIIVNGKKIGGFGITGELDVVRPLARIAVRMIASWISEIGYREKLERSEEKFRNIFNNFQDVYFETTLDGRIVTSSPSGSTFSGYPLEEIIGNTVDILYNNPEDRHLLLKELGKHGRARDLEMLFKRKDGSVYDVSINADIVTDDQGRPTGLKGTIRDITDRKKTERELQKSEEKFRLIFEHAPLGILHFDARGIITACNDIFVGIIGSSRRQLVGLNMLELPDTRIVQALTTALKGSTALFEGDYTAVTSERTIPVRAVFTPIFSKEGEPDGGIGIIEDVTEKKRTQELLIQSEKMMSIGGLAAGMAHEINNPLAGMIQNAQVAINRVTRDLPANEAAAKRAGTTLAAIRAYMEDRQILRHLEQINTAGLQAAKIVRNMLSFARKGEPVKSLQDLPKLIEATLDLIGNDYDLKKRFDFKTIRIIQDIEPGLPPVPCEETRIRQVLFNIVKNSIDAFTSDAEPPETRELRFILSLDGPMVRLVIEDNGPGIDETTRKRIFEPFFTTKGVNQGTGLGLSISYFIIVDDHKGELSVESTPGRGARFIIRLPVSA